MKGRLSVLTLILVAVLGLTLIGGGATVMAQGATPVASPATTGCTVAPRPVDQLLALWYGPQGTPVATPLPSSPVASAAQLPQGTPADAATITALTAVAQEVTACANAGEFARYFALFTDQLARQYGPEPGTTEAQARSFLTTPQTVPANQQLTFLSLHDARVLSDGRVGAVLEINDPTSQPSHQTAFVIFMHSGSQWLVDDLIPVGPQGTPVAGTPAA